MQAPSTDLNDEWKQAAASWPSADAEAAIAAQADADNIMDEAGVVADIEPSQQGQRPDGEGFAKDNAEGEARPGALARIDVQADALRIGRTKGTEEHSQVINEAWRAWRAGDMARAKSKYAEALKAYPDNRDAMLGLAAVAMNEGDMGSASAMYSYLSELYPQDPLPRVALMGLQPEQQSIEDETTIREMLFEQPENPFLYFTLGKLYASQSRWPEAQQAFFNACRFDQANPGYALNLAISLDHMGQRKAALHYYDVAVSLAGRGDGSFDPAAITRRIRTLSSQVRP